MSTYLHIALSVLKILKKPFEFLLAHSEQFEFKELLLLSSAQEYRVSIFTLNLPFLPK